MTTFYSKPAAVLQLQMLLGKLIDSGLGLPRTNRELGLNDGVADGVGLVWFSAVVVAVPRAERNCEGLPHLLLFGGRRRRRRCRPQENL